MMPSVLAIDAWDIEANILGVVGIANPPIAPEIAKLTGHAVATVVQAMIGMEERGLLRKTGQAAGWTGELFERWERVK